MNRILANILVSVFIVILIMGCDSNPKPNSQNEERLQADILLINGTIYTVDDNNPVVSALAISGDTILAVGKTDSLKNRIDAKQIIDLEGKAVYPGFIDGHCHFLGYGRTLFNVDLVGTTSLGHVVSKTTEFFGPNPKGWVQGRGWDQNDWKSSGWDVSQFPTKKQLDSIYPNNPVALRRVDGHAVWANSLALEMANISNKTVVEGGEILLGKNNEPTGILIDNAADLVLNIIPENIKEKDAEAVQKAQQNCLAVGLTCLMDAGLPLVDVQFLAQQNEEGKLNIRVYQMIKNDSDAIAYFEKNGPIETPNFTVKAIKCYMDGALGSRGAWLKSNYTDALGKSGLQLTPTNEFAELLLKAKNMNFQVGTHAIGDKAVEVVLDEYSKILEPDNDRRWRVEHSQIVDEFDINKYGQHKILPSIQTTHATSDMYWADERLGDRITTAYAYQDLLKQNQLLINGSDFPVESINPLYGFYAAVNRRDLDGFPEIGFQTNNALTREQALKAMTIWAAYGQFQEDKIGSLEVGKWADFVILEKDIMVVSIEEVPYTKVLATYIAGKKWYEAN
ncbi:MAG: amidohydrolase [Bacteroidetes bacterium]|nr:amidohydrolase [Bacteroidota bacterium]